MTWNLWWRFGPQWQERQPGIAATIRAANPDLVALQEVWAANGTTQAHHLAADLGLHAGYAAPGLPPPPDPPEHPDQAGVEVGIGLLSRWPVAAARTVAMPTKHRDGVATLLATVAHPEGPLHVAVACLEWEPAYDEDRMAQGRALADLATDPALDGPLPVVVAGDLNAAPDSPVLGPLHERMIDAWTAAGGDPRAVSLSSRHPFAPREATELIDQRIDHVFVRPGHTGQRLHGTQAVLAGDPIGGLDPSDHLAVVCDIGWT
jgi:endonuclease/exonuclease/phosphatase family metal-dependent hydrolase